MHLIFSLHTHKYELIKQSMNSSLVINTGMAFYCRYQSTRRTMCQVAVPVVRATDSPTPSTANEQDTASEGRSKFTAGCNYYFLFRFKVAWTLTKVWNVVNSTKPAVKSLNYTCHLAYYLSTFSLTCIYWLICAEKRITIHQHFNNSKLHSNLWADSVPPPGESNSTNSASNPTVAGTNIPPPATRSVVNMPAIKFLTRPDLFSIIQNNEVRLSICACNTNYDNF